MAEFTELVKTNEDIRNILKQCVQDICNLRINVPIQNEQKLMKIMADIYGYILMCDNCDGLTYAHDLLEHVRGTFTG